MKQFIFIFFVDFQLSRSHFGSRNCWLGKPPALPKQEQRWQQCCRYGCSFAWCPCVVQRKGWKCMDNLRSWKWNSTGNQRGHVSRKVYDFQFKGTAFVLLGDLESLWLDHGSESGVHCRLWCMHVGFGGNFACWAASCKRPLHSSNFAIARSTFFRIEPLAQHVVHLSLHFEDLIRFDITPYADFLERDILTIYPSPCQSLSTCNDRCPMSSSTVRRHIAASP